MAQETDPDVQRCLAQAQHELREAREQQAATAEVLRIISRSAEDLRPVFETILANARRLCQAKFGNLDLRVGDGFRVAALHNAPQAYIQGGSANLWFTSVVFRMFRSLASSEPKLCNIFPISRRTQPISSVLLP